MQLQSSAEVGMLECVGRRKSVFDLVLEAAADELLGCFAHPILLRGLCRKLHFESAQNNSLVVDLSLRNPMPERLTSVEHFEEDDPQ